MGALIILVVECWIPINLQRSNSSLGGRVAVSAIFGAGIIPSFETLARTCLKSVAVRKIWASSIMILAKSPFVASNEHKL